MAEKPKLPATIPPGALLRRTSAEADFDRALAGNKKTARSRITKELREMVEKDPESFARGIRGLIRKDE